MDAVNPAYFDIESQPDQEQPIDPQGDISHFSLSDQVGNLFRSHKLGRNAQKTHARPTQGERAVNLGVEEQSMVDGRLPADEQEECYRQQNIESPSHEEPPKSNWIRGQEPQAMPIMDIAQEPQTWQAAENSPEVNDKRSKMFSGRDIEKQEVDSLYSDPEQILKLKKKKSASQSRSPEVLSECSRVYKPLGMEAEFPVYDEDLDFHPDPLQGILDDKYWLDPQEQEAVIRKYIDLAAANIMSEGMDYGKRNAEKGEYEVKSVNSKIGFKNVDSQCPCKEISSCGDCSKGKKKTNYSEIVGENVLYGSHNDYNHHYMSDDRNSKDTPGLNYGNAPIYDKVDGILRFNEKPFLPLNEKSNILVNEIKGEMNDGSLKKNNIIGRQILWYDAYDEDDESYNDVDELVKNSHPILTEVSADEQITDREGADWSENENPNSMSKYTRPIPLLGELISDNSHKPLDSNNLTSTYDQLNQGLKKTKISLLKTVNKPPGYYTSNKLANMLQKPFQENPKGPKKNRTDPSYEFEVIRNQTLYNATFEATSEKPARPKVCFKRGDINFESDSPKNRRSFSDLPIDGKNQQVAHLYLPSDGSSGSDLKDGQYTFNPSKPADSSTPQTQAINCTNVGNNVTTVSPNKTSQLISNHSKQSLKSKLDDRDAEERVDAEVANDIVETVISESEKGSVLGHNLGICKKNESVTKIKYGQIVPEAEKVLKSVTDCIMDRVKAHLALQSCILLDNELLEFLKWLVLSGESYKEYMQRLGPKYYDFVPVTTANVTTCGPPTTQMCEQEPLPPNPNVVSSLNSESANLYR